MDSEQIPPETPLTDEQRANLKIVADHLDQLAGRARGAQTKGDLRDLSRFINETDLDALDVGFDQDERDIPSDERTIDPNIDDARLAKLGQELVDVLLPHVGERGGSESAVEVLQRIIRERDQSTEGKDATLQAIADDGKPKLIEGRMTLEHNLPPIPVNRTASAAPIVAQSSTEAIQGDGDWPVDSNSHAPVGG